MTVQLSPLPTDHHLALLGVEPVIFHCHHYNVVLQQSIEDVATQFPVGSIEHDGAAIVAHHQLSHAFEGTDRGDRLPFAAEYFRLRGFGLLDLGGLTDQGGTVSLRNSHYALGFKTRGVQRDAPACKFACGYVAGALAAAHDLPAGSFRATETSCVARGDDGCRISVERLPTPAELAEPVGLGAVPEPMPPRPAPVPSHIDEQAIAAGVSSLPLAGNEEGLLPAFGVYLTQHYANYYNHLSAGTEKLIRDKAPSLAAAVAEVLGAAGHVCAFNTFGGIMKSPEWYGLVAPMLRESSDWIYGIVAVANCFGWGRWTVMELVEGERLVVRVDASYESNYALAAHGVGDYPTCHLVRGGVAGLMNLLYVGDIKQKPTLDQAYYDEIFSGPESFQAVETKCRSKGDDYCEFVATRRSW